MSYIPKPPNLRLSMVELSKAKKMLNSLNGNLDKLSESSVKSLNRSYSYSEYLADNMGKYLEYDDRNLFDNDLMSNNDDMRSENIIPSFEEWLHVLQIHKTTLKM